MSGDGKMMGLLRTRRDGGFTPPKLPAIAGEPSDGALERKHFARRIERSAARLKPSAGETAPPPAS